MPDTFEHVQLDRWVLLRDTLQHGQRPEGVVFALDNKCWAAHRFERRLIAWPRPAARRNGMPEHHQRRRRLDGGYPRAYSPAKRATYQHHAPDATCAEALPAPADVIPFG